MNSVHDMPKLQPQEQYSLTSVAQGCPATQSYVPSQESAIITAVKNIIQIVCLNILESIKMCALTERFCDVKPADIMMFLFQKQFIQGI